MPQHWHPSQELDLQSIASQLTEKQADLDKQKADLDRMHSNLMDAVDERTATELKSARDDNATLLSQVGQWVGQWVGCMTGQRCNG